MYDEISADEFGPDLYEAREDAHVDDSHVDEVDNGDYYDWDDEGRYDDEDDGRYDVEPPDCDLWNEW